MLAVVLVLLIVGLLYDQQNSESGQPSGPGVATVIAPADLCWSGAFDDRTVEGCGNSTVPLKGMSGIYSANAQKQDDSLGELTLVLTIDGQEVDRTSTQPPTASLASRGHGRHRSQGGHPG